MLRAAPETLLSYHALTVGSLVSNPATELDKAVNKLRTKYRSYIVEYDVEDGAVRLPNLFAADFGDEITRFATLVDTKENQFEVLVDKVNGGVFFSKGWKSLRDFYNIRFGAWITLVFAESGTFAMVLKDRFGKVIKPPLFDPPMHFAVDRSNVTPDFNHNLLPLTSSLSYRHHNNNFTVQMVKILTDHDVSRGFLVLNYGPFVEQALDRARTNLRIVDECGNFWECALVFASAVYGQCMIGGGWRRFVEARNLREGFRMRIGVPAAGDNSTLFVKIYDD